MNDNGKNGIAYKFKVLDRRRRMDDKLLLCPKCKEQLWQADIENYSRCPFCNCELELNQQLEDFILKPLVDHWIRQQSASQQSDMQ